MSVGYFNDAEKVGAQFDTLRGRLAMLPHRIRPHKIDSEEAELIYYDTCLFAIDLENAAIAYLQEQIGQGDPQRDHIAETLIDEHRTALDSLWGRINYGQENPMEPTTEIEHGVSEAMPEGMKHTFASQFEKAREYADEVDAGAFTIELDQIRLLRENHEITEHVAHKLREDVYLLQMQMQLQE